MPHRGSVPIIAVLLVAPVCLAQPHARPWETWQPPAVTLPTPNAFDTYLKAFALKDQIDADHGIGELEEVPGQPPDRWHEGPPDLPLPERLNLYADVLKLVREALAQECRIPPPTSTHDSMEFFDGFRAVARLLAMEAEVHRLDGDFMAAANCALDALEMAQDASSHRTIVASLVAIACEAIAVKSLDETMLGLKADECRRVLARMLQLERTRLPVGEMLSGEELFVRLSFKEMMADQKQQRASQPPIAAPHLLSVLLLAMGEQMSVWGWTGIDEAHHDFRRYAALPYARRPRPFPPPRDSMMQIIAPLIERVLFKDDPAVAALRLRQAELAVRAYRQERDHLPDNLDMLVPNYLPAVPSDPFGEGPLRAKAATESLVIYSIGPDGVDDGGMPYEGRTLEANSMWDIIVRVSLNPKP